MGDVTTAITEVQRMTGTTGPALEGLSKQFITLSKISGTDLKGNVDAGSKALENWNLHGKDALTAMDQLFLDLAEERHELLGSLHSGCQVLAAAEDDGVQLL